MAALLSGQAEAQPSAQKLTQYDHSAWRVRDGAFVGENGIVQTEDGYFWLGTDSGLIRFDGVRFVPFNEFENGSTENLKIVGLWAAHDGALWIGGNNFVARIKGGRIDRYRIEGRLSQFAEDDHGTIWFVQSRVNGHGGPLCSVAKSELNCFGKPDLPLVNAGTVLWTPRDGLWVGDASTLCRFTAASTAQCRKEEALVPFDNLQGITALLQREGGGVYVGVSSPGAGAGFVEFDGRRWASYATSEFDGSKLSVSALSRDGKGGLWVGTVDRGLFHLDGGHIDHYGSSDGLSSDTVNDLYEDREGTMWVSTPGGIDSFRRLPVSVFSGREGLPADVATSVLPARDGRVWVASSQLAILDKDQVVRLPDQIEAKGKQATSLFEDHAGRMWVGLNDTLNVLDGGRFTSIPNSDGKPLGVVIQLVEDAAMQVWALTAGRGQKLYRIDGTKAELISERLPQIVAMAIAPDPSAGLWIGGFKGELVHYQEGAAPTVTRPVEGSKMIGIAFGRDGTLLGLTPTSLLVQRGGVPRIMSAANGLPCGEQTSLSIDADDGLWVLARCGLVFIEGNEWKRWTDAPTTKVRYRLLDVSDGVRPGIASFTPRAAFGPDGRLWFANETVLQVVDPAAMLAPRGRPRVVVEQVVADHAHFPPTSALRLEPKTRDIEIDYTAPTSTAPQRIRFAYRLQGRDSEWQEAGSRRQAFYTDLSPGHYRFLVKANTGDGYQDATGGSVDIEIPPMFYQTRWFVVMCVVVTLLCLYSLYVVRMRQVAAAVHERLAVKNAERERIARDLHDTLLQSVQALILRFQRAARRIPEGELARDLMERALERADATMVESRERVHALRELGHGPVDLVASLREVCTELSDVEGSCPIDVEVTGTARSLHPVAADESFLIAREAIVNAVTHAAATRIEVRALFEKTRLVVTVADDGVGISAEIVQSGRANHWGIVGMRERARKLKARITIASRAPRGTVVEISVPGTVCYARTAT